MRPMTVVAALALVMGVAQAQAQPYQQSPRVAPARTWDEDWERRARFRCNQSWDWWCAARCWRTDRGYIDCQPKQEDRDRDEFRGRDWRRWP